MGKLSLTKQVFAIALHIHHLIAVLTSSQTHSTHSGKHSISNLLLHQPSICRKNAPENLYLNITSLTKKQKQIQNNFFFYLSLHDKLCVMSSKRPRIERNSPIFGSGDMFGGNSSQDPSYSVVGTPILDEENVVKLIQVLLKGFSHAEKLKIIGRICIKTVDS